MPSTLVSSRPLPLRSWYRVSATVPPLAAHTGKRRVAPSPLRICSAATDFLPNSVSLANTATIRVPPPGFRFCTSRVLQVCATAGGVARPQAIAPAVVAISRVRRWFMAGIPEWSMSGL